MDSNQQPFGYTSPQVNAAVDRLGWYARRLLAAQDEAVAAREADGRTTGHDAVLLARETDMRQVVEPILLALPDARR